MSSIARDTEANAQTLTHRRAWHQGADSPNIFPDGVPLERVREALAWQARSGKVIVRIPATLEGKFDGIDDEGHPYRDVHVPTMQGVYHSDTDEVFKVHSSTYKIHQHNVSVVDNVEALLAGAGELIVGSFGQLDGGATAWLSVELRDTFKLDDYGVEFLPRLLAIGSHNGKHATTYKRTITNVVCRNTMAMALRESTEKIFKIRHSSRSDVKVLAARDALDLLDLTGQVFAASVTEAVQTPVTNQQWFKFLDTIVPVPEDQGAGRTKAQNKQAALNNLWVNDQRVAPWKNTAWGAVQAVNTWEQWGKRVIGATREERNAERTLAGKFDQLDQDTMSVLTGILA